MKDQDNDDLKWWFLAMGLALIALVIRTIMVD